VLAIPGGRLLLSGCGLTANISAKTKCFAKIFWGVTQGPMYSYYLLIKKTRAQKSHATVPLKYSI